MKKSCFLLGSLAAAGLLSLSSPAFAATFNVNVFDDPAPSDAPNGCSSGGRCSLREAVLSANFDSNEDIIVLQAGPYVLTIPENGSAKDGDLDIFGPGAQTGKTVIRGAGSDATIIEAAPSLQDPLIEIETGFVSFADYWRSFLGGTGPAPSYVASLDAERRARLRRKLAETLRPAADGTLTLTARAWAARGTVR